MFTGCSEGVFFSKGDRKSMVRHTLSHCQNLAMCSHDAHDAGYAGAMRAMCRLCGRDARYARAPYGICGQDVYIVGGTWATCRSAL